MPQRRRSGPDRPEPGRLQRLRAAIELEHAHTLAAYGNAVAHAIRAGELLLEVKGLVGHGRWLPWLAENFPASVRTAQGYMRLARNPTDAQRVAHLGIAEALRALGCGALPANEA